MRRTHHLVVDRRHDHPLVRVGRDPGRRGGRVHHCRRGGLPLVSTREQEGPDGDQRLGIRRRGVAHENGGPRHRAPSFRSTLRSTLRSTVRSTVRSGDRGCGRHVLSSGAPAPNESNRSERLRLPSGFGSRRVMSPGLGALVNVATILLGTVIGVLVGHRLSQRTRDVVTDALGLVTLLIAGTSAVAIADDDWAAAVGDSAPMLIVLGSLLLGGVVGSMRGIEQGLESFGAWFQARLTSRSAGQRQSAERQRFIEGFVSSSLVFCVGPLTVLGSVNDGLGNGADQLYLKAALDGFAAIAFAASLGWGVAASALSVLLVQGTLTLLGAVVGGVLPAAELAALTATGGLMLVGVALRLLRIRQVPVGDLLPGLVVAPALTALVTLLR